MMERNGMLLAGKKIIKGLLVSSIVLASAQADFLMTLTDKSGVEENLCVKSYSFSNNLVSLHNKSGQYIDEYSTKKEVLTNKTWDGKPVYRRVFANLTGFIDDNTWRKIQFNNSGDNIDNLIDAEIKFGASHEQYTVYLSANTQFRYRIEKNFIVYISEGNYVNNTTSATVVLEYTKTTDTVNTNKLEPTSYVHYIPSDSTTNQLLSKSLNETGIRFLNNYTYDASTNSCISPTN